LATNNRETAVLILELCRERGSPFAEAAKATGANRNTIKDHVQALTAAGHLVQHGAYGLV
jgi:predicted ArsR family transcriptional regulator